MVPLHRRLAAELLGTLMLAAIVIGSGIAASRLSPDDAGLRLLENALATASGLFVLIVVLLPISGAHLNPVVTLVDAALGLRSPGESVAYVVAQIVGGVLGAILADLMFGLPAIALSTADRLTPGSALGEAVATAGLITAIFVLARTGRGQWTAAAVAAWIGSAYFFTSSTSFANPAVTVARVLTNTFAGISPLSAVAFLAAQLIGAGVGFATIIVLTGGRTSANARVAETARE